MATTVASSQFFTSTFFFNGSKSTCASSGTECRNGLVLPAWPPPSYPWMNGTIPTYSSMSFGDRVLRGSVYLILLVYMFWGISVSSDCFMDAIDRICKTRVRILRRRKDGTRYERRPLLWNATVANLTLMALGSSAPEILLSTIEIIKEGFSAGELGPGTIVGSAAYNLFVIPAVCILAVNEGSKSIEMLRVFCVTAAWSLFAYVWLYMMLGVISYGVVEVWEAVLTLAFLGLTVLTSWLVDRKCYAKRCCRTANPSNAHSTASASMCTSAKASDANANPLQPSAGLLSTPARANNLPVISEEEPGGSSGSPQPQPDVTYEAGPPERLQMLPQAHSSAAGADHTETQKQSHPRTTSMSRYRHIRESVTAALGIRIVNDDTEEDDESTDEDKELEKRRTQFIDVVRQLHQKLPSLNVTQLEAVARPIFLSHLPKDFAFYKKVASRPSYGTAVIPNLPALESLIGSGAHFLSSDAALTETDDYENESDELQRIRFEKWHYTVMENAGIAQLKLLRSGGDLSNRILVKFSTRDKSALRGRHYIHEEVGTVIFEKDVGEAMIEIRIVDNRRFENDLYFIVVIEHVELLPPLETHALEPVSAAALQNHDHGLESDHTHEHLHEERLPALAYPSSATVLILDDDHPGVLGFTDKCLTVPDTQEELAFNVHRFLGVRGRVTLPYHVYRVMRGKARKQSVSQRSTSLSFSTPGPAPAHTPTSQTSGTAHPPITIDAPPTTSEAARAGLLAAPGADIKPRSASEGAAVVSVGGGSNAHVHDHLAVPRPATGAQGSFATISDTSEAEQLFHGELNFEDRIHMQQMTINISSEIALEKSRTILPFDILIQVDEPVLHIPEGSEPPNAQPRLFDFARLLIHRESSSAPRKASLAEQQVKPNPRNNVRTESLSSDASTVVVRAVPIPAPSPDTQHKQLGAADSSNTTGARRPKNEKPSVWREWGQKCAEAFKFPSRKPSRESEMEEALEDAVLLPTPFVALESNQADSTLAPAAITIAKKLVSSVMSAEAEESAQPNSSSPAQPLLAAPATLSPEDPSKAKLQENGNFLDGDGDGDIANNEADRRQTSQPFWRYVLKIVFYVLGIPWKFIEAVVPPSRIWNGWLAFVVSIFIIGIQTALVGDLASHFGCSVGIKDTITAISFIALGTSVPDTFASRIAALSERTADSAIGNVTGSNAVNVFLGIGLAWTIAAVVHAIKGEPFRVDPGNLAFAVILFLALALVAIGLLLVRRFLRIHGQRGELGGWAPARYVSAALFIGIWFFYLAVSSMETFCVFRF